MQKNRRKTLILPEGKKYIGELKQGLRHGKGEEVDRDGKVIRKGRWKDDVYIGE